ncbi:MAG TPA: class I SAM-dependent methyltransferase [Burkholderiales bacterium]|nr:class I SAM-dependent methyltransferase [Burkholderiales bacterium]
MSAEEMKAKEFQSWSSVSPGWRKHDKRLTQSFDVVSTALLDRAGIQAGQSVLDVACGTGEPAIPAAKRVGSRGKVLATDFVPGMVEFAKEKARAQSLSNIEFTVTDGELLDLPQNAFDAGTMRWGLMFMPDPLACLRRILAALKPGAIFATATWASPDKNPWASVPLAVMKGFMELPAPVPGQTGIFAFGDPERLKATMRDAGFRDVGVEALEVLWSGPATGKEYFGEVIEMAGPLATLYGRLPEDKKRAYADEVAAQAERQSVRKPGVALPGVTWIAWGRK